MGWRPSWQWSSGRRACRRKAMTIASPSGIKPVEGGLGPVARSATVCRARHFCTVVGLTPERLTALTLPHQAGCDGPPPLCGGCRREPGPERVLAAWWSNVPPQCGIRVRADP